MREDTLGETLHRLLHGYRRALRQGYQEGRIDLPVSCIRALKSVQGTPSCTAQAIAARTQLDKAQITRALNDLVAEGLVEKRDNPEDRRSSLVALTAAGKAVMRKIRTQERRAGARMAQGLAPEEVSEFVRLADRMLGNLAD